MKKKKFYLCANKMIMNRAIISNSDSQPGKHPPRTKPLKYEVLLLASTFGGSEILSCRLQVSTKTVCQERTGAQMGGQDLRERERNL